jgi:TRAP-type C4-dicarboxylate transport system permease small subunit
VFDKATFRLSHFGANVATCALFVIMMVSALDVASRNLLGRSVPGALESSEVVLVVGAFLGLAYAQRLRTHVATSFLVELLPRRFARLIRSAGLLAVSSYVGWATWLTAPRAWQSFVMGEARFGLVEIPQWPARFAIAIGFGLLFFELLRDLIREIRSGEQESHSSQGTM